MENNEENFFQRIHEFQAAAHYSSDFFPPPSPMPMPMLHPFYGDVYGRRAFGYGGATSSEALGLYVGPDALARAGKMSAQEIMDAKALAASKSHSEAERRRRERINAHFAKLRSLLPSTTKTDKASLLAEVIQHVKELKRQTLEIAEESPLPTESDELTVDTTNDEDGRLIIRASLCCEDRSDLLPDLIKALKALRLRALKAEITTLGGRVKNVLLIAGDNRGDQLSVASIHEALKTVMDRAASEDPIVGQRKQATEDYQSTEHS